MTQTSHSGLAGILESRRFPGMRVQKDISGVYDPALGCRVTSNLHRQEVTKRKGKELCDAEDVLEENVTPTDLNVKDFENYRDSRLKEGSAPEWLKSM